MYVFLVDADFLVAFIKSCWLVSNHTRAVHVYMTFKGPKRTDLSGRLMNNLCLLLRHNRQNSSFSEQLYLRTQLSLISSLNLRYYKIYETIVQECHSHSFNGFFFLLFLT